MIESLPDQQALLDEMVLLPDNLEEGMVLAQDLVSNSGIMLLPKGQLLTEFHIEKIQKLGNLTVHIKSQEASSEVKS